jgi:hypothetical protein
MRYDYALMWVQGASASLNRHTFDKLAVSALFEESIKRFNRRQGRVLELR